VGKAQRKRQTALQTWVAGPALFRSASGLPELWIALERELVGAAGGACSRACVIQSGRERQHSKLGWRVPLFRSASGLPELWIALERELVGAAGGACSRARVIQSGRERQHSKLGWRVPLFRSASGLPELWIASERELVGAAGGACSRAVGRRVRPSIPSVWTAEKLQVKSVLSVPQLFRTAAMAETR